MSRTNRSVGRKCIGKACHDPLKHTEFLCGIACDPLIKHTEFVCGIACDVVG
jgi:hypothetical protein